MKAIYHNSTQLNNRGTEVFGSLDQFEQWMDTVLIPFGNKKPKEFLGTPDGLNMILDELGRIEHGVLA